MNKDRQKLFVRILALVMAVIMCLGLVAVAASAEENAVNVMRRPEDMSEVNPEVACEEPFWGQYSIPRAWIHRIDFQSTKEGAPENVLDFSEKLDKSVIGWYRNGVLTIAADGKINLNKKSAWMFAYFTSLEELNFNGCVETVGVETMEALFFCCKQLKSVDVSGFDTSAVKDMSRMFGHCEKLETVDVSGFNTSAVNRFCFMFFNDKKLANLDVSNFDTAAGQYFASMFYNCRSLENLNTENFDMSNAFSTAYMYNGVPAAN